MANCFVIMGFGEKVDLATGRKLDLNKTYENIIKPAVEETGLECIRADEVQHSGYIDQHMYERLFTADVVIADLSTGNNNAFYELGVRHALRPYTTIVIAETEFKVPFDVNRVVVRTYEHLGKDIGHSETMRFRALLVGAIKEIRNRPAVDSPVYTFLKDLSEPKWTQNAQAAVPADQTGQSLGALRNGVEAAKGQGDWTGACTLLHAICAMAPADTWARQQLGLALYKRGDDVVRTAKKNLAFDAKAVREARELYAAAEEQLKFLKPNATADAETLGLWGALFKRLYELEADVPPDQRIESEQQRSVYLNEAIDALQRGYFILSDYYNGINLAYLLSIRAAEGTGHELIADYVTAKRVREKVIAICDALLATGKLRGDDAYWVAATAEEAWFGLGVAQKHQEWATRAAQLATKDWMRNSTNEQLRKLDVLLKRAEAKLA